MIDLKKYQKQIMAVFSIGLMIAFALPSAVSKYSSGREVVVGYAGKDKITNKQIIEAKAEWENLRQVRLTRQNQADPTGQPDVIPITDFYLGQAKVAEIQSNPELYVLLQHEADQMGVTANQDQVHEMVSNRIRFPDDVLPDSELLPLVENFVKVLIATQRASSTLQASTPEVQTAMSREQSISLNLTEFKAADYLPQVPPYTEAQKLQRATEQYNAYKDYEPTTRPSDPKTGNPQNDFSFGYRMPNQVQTQYIEIPRDAAARLVRSRIQKVDAIKYYLSHQDKYPTTRPGQQTTFRASPPPPTVAPTSRPTTRPAVAKWFTDEVTSHMPLSQLTFPDYQKVVYDDLTNERADQLTTDMLADINSVIAADYADFKKSPAAQMLTATSTSMPATAPAVPNSSLGVPYTSDDYLQKLALREQEKFQLLPTTGRDVGLRTQQQLIASETIGQANVPEYGQIISFLAQRSRDLTQVFQAASIATFPGYATNLIEPLTSPVTSQLAKGFRLRSIALFEPSSVFRNGGFSKEATGGVFIFRAVRAVPAHPAPQNEIMDQLLADARLKDAYELARKDAQKFAAEASKSHLSAAASASGKKVVATGMLDPRLPPDLGAYPIGDRESTGVFTNGAYQLLSLGQKSQHPIGVIDFRPHGSVLVGEVNEIKAPWTANTQSAYERLVQLRTNGADQGAGQAIWFNANDIMRRTQYRELNPSKKSGSPSPAPVRDEQPAEPPLGG